MKILVLGAQGMAGHIIKNYLKEQGHEVVGTSRDWANRSDLYLNAESQHSRNWFFQSPYAQKGFDFVINCIGVLGPDSNKDPARTVLLNSWWPHYLATTYSDSNTKVVHISTDCIFDGTDGEYTESDLPTETGIYGRSKAMGELNNDKDITLRMSIIGTEIKKTNRSGLLNWVINNPEDTITGWEASIWNGITTYELAKQINNYINNPIVTGIYHLVPDFTISKYDLVCLINEVFECDKTVLRVPGKSEDKTLFNTRNEKKVFKEIPSYRQQLIELRDFTRKIST